MLPAGHIAAGFLSAEIVLKSLPESAQAHKTALLTTGAFAGFAPDLDSFWAFAMNRDFKIDNNNADHRKFFTHTPVFWLIISGLVYFFAGTNFSVIFLAGSFSHLFLDSIYDGVMWLWPLNAKKFSFFGRIFTGLDSKYQNASFFKHWWGFMVWYSKNRTLLLWLEGALIVIALVVGFK